MHTRVRKVLQR